MSEGTGSLAVATIAVTDADRHLVTFSLVGDDVAALVGTTVFCTQAQPDYETIDIVSLFRPDPGGKTYAEVYSRYHRYRRGSVCIEIPNDNTSADATFTDYVRGASSTEASVQPLI